MNIDLALLCRIAGTVCFGLGALLWHPHVLRWIAGGFGLWLMATWV